MSDINRIPSAPSTPAGAPNAGPNAVDIATTELGQRIEQTTEGAASAVTTNPAGGATGTQRKADDTRSVRPIQAIPESEEKLIQAIEEHLEQQIQEVRAQIDAIKKTGGRGMAYQLTVKVAELRGLHATIKSLYEMAKTKLVEFYKTIFKVS